MFDPAALGRAFVSQPLDRQALWLPVAFGIGVGCYFALLSEPPFWLVPTLLVICLLLLAVCRRYQAALLFIILAMTMLAGTGVAQWRAHVVAAPVIAKKLSGREIAGVINKVEIRESGLRVTLAVEQIRGLEPAATPRLVRLTSRFRQPDLVPGDPVSVRAMLLPPPEAPMPGGFDFVRRAWFQQIGAVGYSLEKFRLTEARAGESLQHQIAGLRQRVTLRILKVFPDDPVTGHLAAALMTGQRGGLPEDVLAAMRDAGLAHLLAISGLHMGLLASLVFFASRALMALVAPLALRWPIKKIAAALALTAAFAYLLMTGATVPTRRAFMMTALVLIAVMLDRRAVSMGLVAWAAGAVLLIAPESLTGPGFQMSFAAVVGLIAVYERWQPYLTAWQRGEGAGPGRGRKILLYIFGVSLTTIVASLATAPFAVAHFGRLATWGLAANLLAVPVMALWIMPWALAAFVLMPLGLEQLALLPMGVGINFVLEVARHVAAWPGAVKVLPAMPNHALTVMAMAGLWLCLWRPTRPAPGGTILGLGGLGLAMVLWLTASPPSLLIDGNARLFGMVTADGQLRVSNRRDSFTLRNWLAGQGLAEASPLSSEKKTGAGTGDMSDLRCDALGCLYRRNGQTVSLVRDLRALADDCSLAGAIISTLPLRRNCLQAPIRIDRFDLWRNGAHALWIDDEGNMRVRSVAASRGQRPWTPVRQRPVRQRPEKLRPERSKQANNRGLAVQSNK